MTVFKEAEATLEGMVSPKPSVSVRNPCVEDLLRANCRRKPLADLPWRGTCGNLTSRRCGNQSQRRTNEKEGEAKKVLVLDPPGHGRTC